MAQLQHTFRYVANRPMKIGYDEATGEATWVQRGEEVPVEHFGSGQAIVSNLHLGRISQIPVLEHDDDGQPRTAFDRDLARRVAELEAENAKLREQLSDDKPNRRKGD